MRFDHAELTIANSERTDEVQRPRESGVTQTELRFILDVENILLTDTFTTIAIM